MDLSILDWFIVIIGMLVLVVLLDGYRRAQRSRRNQVRLSKNAKRSSKKSPVVDKFTSELPNGGARFLSGSNVHIEPGFSAADNFNVNDAIPETLVDKADDVEPFSQANTGLDNGGTLSADDELDPLFVDPFKVKSQSSVKLKQHNETSKSFDSLSLGTKNQPVPPIETEPENSTENDESQPCLFEGEVENKAKPEAAEEIIVLNVIAANEEGFAGEDLLHILLACDCRFGDMNIFHRYEEANEQGPIQFSIVNMVKPGIFDLKNISEFSTPGVSFFVQLPGPVDPIKAFDDMVDTAKCLVRNLNGALKDEVHSAATEQTIDHCRERIRSFQKKRLISA